MFKSKHSGWTWELRRTPFGGGGGGGFSGITDSISSAIGTDGSGGGALGALASIDPGPAVGNALASADKFMTNLTPYGWALPAALVAAYFTAGGSLAAEGAAAGATEAATAAGEAAYAEAAAAGASEAEAVAAGNAAADASLSSASAAAGGTSTAAGGTGLTGGAGGSTGLLAGGTTSGLTIPGGAAIAVDPAIAAGTGAGIDSAGAVGGGTVGGLSAGASNGAGSLSSQLAPGTILGTGAPGGGAIGSSYAAGANGLPATDFFGNYIPASSINTGGVPNTVTGTNITSDTLNTLNNVKKGTDAANKLSQLLNQGAASGLSSSLGKLAAGQNASPEALPNLVRGNQSPFAYTAQQPIRDAQPMDLSSLANLLKQG